MLYQTSSPLSPASPSRKRFCRSWIFSPRFLWWLKESSITFLTLSSAVCFNLIRCTGLLYSGSQIKHLLPSLFTDAIIHFSPNDRFSKSISCPLNRYISNFITSPLQSHLSIGFLLSGLADSVLVVVDLQYESVKGHIQVREKIFAPRLTCSSLDDFPVLRFDAE